MEWLPCPHCGNEDLDLLHNNLCVIYGEKVANVYCSECRAQAPQETWNKRPAQNSCTIALSEDPERGDPNAG